ncbi:hypothetical protein SAMN05421760_1011059 [Neptunomonas antarctica]|uniref:Uncharacterized protein n=1 Tax=Neptunomonas antarctica TaxID=619304 RepID=A0A1N7JF22_9GAMM|nr:hypothetical protein SAMN05421760_1011059 [Neptunomonas antarctica]
MQILIYGDCKLTSIDFYFLGWTRSKVSGFFTMIGVVMVSSNR